MSIGWMDQQRTGAAPRGVTEGRRPRANARVARPAWGRQVSSRTLEPDLRWAYDLGLDTLLPYLKVPPALRPVRSR